METYICMKNLVRSQSINYYLINPKQRKKNTVFNRIRDPKLTGVLRQIIDKTLLSAYSAAVVINTVHDKESSSSEEEYCAYLRMPALVNL